jgi:hypothetical protein
VSQQLQAGIDAAKEAGKFAVKTSQKAMVTMSKAKLDTASLFNTYVANGMCFRFVKFQLTRET